MVDVHIHLREREIDAVGGQFVQLQVRVWVESDNYWAVFYDYNERIYNELPSHGINFPFPQMDVHINHVVEKPVS